VAVVKAGSRILAWKKRQSLDNKKSQGEEMQLSVPTLKPWIVGGLL
jgi:hypothetical protein